MLRRIGPGARRFARHPAGKRASSVLKQAKTNAADSKLYGPQRLEEIKKLRTNLHASSPLNPMPSFKEGRRDPVLVFKKPRPVINGSEELGPRHSTHARL